MAIDKLSLFKVLVLASIAVSGPSRLAAATPDDLSQNKIITLLLSEIEQLKNAVAKPGFVQPFAGTVAPKGWVFCDGAVLKKAEFPALYAAIGDTYNRARDQATGHGSRHDQHQDQYDSQIH